MKVIVLDVDGVIVDSQMECLFIGFNSYLKLHKNTKLFSREKMTFDNFNRFIKKHNETVNKYKKLRPYVIDAFCYYVTLYIIDNNIKINNQNQYNNTRKKLMEKYNKYVKYFYNERYLLQKKNFRKWLSLDIPFKKIINGIKNLGKRYVIAIATTKTLKSVERSFKEYKLRPKVIATADLTVDKKKQLEHIKNKLKVNFDDIHFVDDQVKHFPKLLKLGIHCYLATWGYNTKKQQKEAMILGVVLLNQNNFYRVLSKQ